MAFKEFEADLSGDQEVPPVDTSATGSAELVANAEETVLHVELEVSDIRNVTVAHLHLAPKGQNGPVVAFLFGPSDPVSFGPGEHLLACRTVTRGDLVGPLAGQPLSALIEQMEAGNVYVNVHTVQHPDGEIRGQVEPDVDEPDTDDPETV